MEIRPATERDVDDVGRVHALSRRAAYIGMLPAQTLAEMTPAGQAGYWRRRLAGEPQPHCVYVASTGGHVGGFAIGTGRGTTATLDAIHVLPDLLGTGAGQALHDRVLADFAAWQCREAVLWVLEENARARSFYGRNGWSLDGERGRHDIGGREAYVVRYRWGVLNGAQLLLKTAGPPSSSPPEAGPRPAHDQA